MMAYAKPPFDKSSTQDANEVPLYSTFRAALPGQDGTGTGHESSGSGSVFGNLQRATVQHTFDIRGTQSEAQISQILSNFKVGDPHPWSDLSGQEGVFGVSPYRSSYVIDIRVEQKTSGAVAGTDDYGQAWARITVTYQQRPCPHRFEQNERDALVVRNEWYSQPDPVTGFFEPLTGTLETIPVLVPVSIVTRYYPRVELDSGQLRAIRHSLRRLNADEFLGEDAGVWILDGAQLSPLFESDPADESPAGFYEVTLVFRSDFDRMHQWWWPKLDPRTKRPRVPTVSSDTYASFHDKRALYRPTETDFDDLVPTVSSACTPVEG